LTGSTHWAAIATTVVVILGWSCAPHDETEGGSSHEPEVAFTLPPLPRWATSDANVREGAGTDFDIVATLDRGEEIQVGALENGWYEAYRDDEMIGWVSESVLSGTPLPERGFRIHSVRFRVAARNETSWRYAWTLELDNTGLEQLTGLAAELKFVDANSYLVATDSVFGMNIEPGQRRTYRGELSVPLPRGADITTVGAEIQVPTGE
jgi:hypothetical protein